MSLACGWQVCTGDTQLLPAAVRFSRRGRPGSVAQLQDEDGWTLAVPERPAAAGRQKRGGEQGGTAGAGKRQRQHKAQEDEGAGSGWGGVACGTGPTGAQHWQQQPQQPQPRPLAAQNGGWMRAPGLQGGGGVAHSAPQAQPRQWQPGAQAAPDQRAWQPPPQQHRQPRQQPPPVQQEQQRWQQAPAKQQAWSSAPHRQQAPAGDPRAGGKGAAHAGAPNRWGGFMDADDEW